MPTLTARMPLPTGILPGSCLSCTWHWLVPIQPWLLFDNLQLPHLYLLSHLGELFWTPILSCITPAFPPSLMPPANLAAVLPQDISPGDGKNAIWGCLKSNEKSKHLLTYCEKPDTQIVNGYHQNFPAQWRLLHPSSSPSQCLNIFRTKENKHLSFPR